MRDKCRGMTFINSKDVSKCIINVYYVFFAFQAAAALLYSNEFLIHVLNKFGLLNWVR